MMNVLGIILLGSLLAQTKTSTADLSGFWELRFDSKNIPPAALVSKVTAKDMEAHRERDRMAIRWCNFLGVPALMEQFPLDIRQGRIEVAIVAQAVSTARHIYTDGRGHVNPHTFDPTTNGHSIGRWEGDTLVIDVNNFSDDTWLADDGLFHSKNMHVVERVRRDGNAIQYSVVVEDPAVLQEPFKMTPRTLKLMTNTEIEEAPPCHEKDLSIMQDLTHHHNTR